MPHIFHRRLCTLLSLSGRVTNLKQGCSYYLISTTSVKLPISKSKVQFQSLALFWSVYNFSGQDGRLCPWCYTKQPWSTEVRVPSFAKWTLLIVYCVVACAYQSPCFSSLREFWSCLIGGLTEQQLGMGDARRYWGRGKSSIKVGIQNETMQPAQLWANLTAVC